MKKIVKRGLSSEEQRIHDIINDDKIASTEEVKSFLKKKQKALENGLACYLYDNEYQADAVCFDIQNKLNDNIEIHMHNASELKQMEQELDEQIKKYNIVVD